MDHNVECDYDLTYLKTLIFMFSVIYIDFYPHFELY